MDKGDLRSGIFWLIVSIFIIVQSYGLGLGALNHPGPGFLFFFTGIFLGILSLSLVGEAWRKRRAEGISQRIFEKVNIRKILFVMIGVFLYALLLEKVGFIVMTIALLVFIFGFIEKRGWLYTALASVMITSAAYLLFQAWLKTQLPRGILEFYRF